MLGHGFSCGSPRQGGEYSISAPRAPARRLEHKATVGAVRRTLQGGSWQTAMRYYHPLDACGPREGAIGV